jgi:predicted phosphoadenosine phosphosulfate sulfurtransferase
MDGWMDGWIFETVNHKNEKRRMCVFESDYNRNYRTHESFVSSLTVTSFEATDSRIFLPCETQKELITRFSLSLC